MWAEPEMDVTYKLGWDGADTVITTSRGEVARVEGGPPSMTTPELVAWLAVAIAEHELDLAGYPDGEKYRSLREIPQLITDALDRRGL